MVPPVVSQATGGRLLLADVKESLSVYKMLVRVMEVSAATAEKERSNASCMLCRHEMNDAITGCGSN